MISWSETQAIEERWWGNCTNTFTEQVKQKVYAEKMGIPFIASQGKYCIPMSGERVLDIGGGPTSLLLMCWNVHGTVADPFQYPAWVYKRYQTAGITLVRVKGEDLIKPGNDEVWLYNLLEHVEDPVKVVANARRAGRLVRVFDWLATKRRGPHRHVLSKPMLDDLFEAEGSIEDLAANECFGQCYYGIFPQERE